MKQALNNHLEWLKTNPSFDELCEKFPKEWASVQNDISLIVERGDAEELKRYLEKLSAAPVLNAPSFGKNQQNAEAILSQYIRSRLAHESVKRLSLSALNTDLETRKGKLRFNLFNGFIAQRLLFASGLIRKPVSLRLFRLFWPILWQKKILMPLVQPKGIYCFYSKPFIATLVEMINNRKCLEIGAGDGTLTGFLKAQGVEITATDNYSWAKSVHYPEWVIKMDAREALTNYSPEVVICSWPPAQNDFESCIFQTPTVQLYIVIGSRHKFAFGNWPAYKQQTTFELVEDTKLSEMVLPPELESVVYIFRRNP
jgi:hypothetical protein